MGIRIDVEKTPIPQETTIFILINCRIFLILIGVVKNQFFIISFELKVDTTELEDWIFENSRKRGESILQHKKGSRSRTRNYESTVHTRRAPNKEQIELQT